MTGTDWKPGLVAAVPIKSVSVPDTRSNAAEISNKIADQGDKVRKLKSEKADKVCFYFLSIFFCLLIILTTLFDLNFI